MDKPIVNKSEIEGLTDEGKQVYVMIGALMADAKEVLDKGDATIKELEEEIVELKAEMACMKIRPASF